VAEDSEDHPEKGGCDKSLDDQEHRTRSLQSLRKEEKGRRKALDVQPRRKRRRWGSEGRRGR
jgi:hypothetical protein